MPGFRPGKVPLNIVKKRFGDEIEQEEINKYVQDVFENKVIPEYEPVGESQMLDLTWEDDKLEATFKIGAKPEFEIEDLDQIQVDRMVHDVTDEEVMEEIDRTLENQGNWEEVEEEITDKSKITVDVLHLNEDGEPLEGEKDENQEIDLRKEEFSEFKSDFKGHSVGDEVNVEMSHDGHSHRFRMLIKKVEKLHKAELTDEFAKKQTDGEAKNVDEYKSLVKSRIQNYYDQSADDLLKNDVIDELVAAHDIDVPEVFMEQVLNQYVQRVAQQAGGELPEDFDEEEYKDRVKDRASRDAQWFFINQKLQEKFDDIEIKPDDVDEYLTAEAARYGVTIDQMRNVFAQNPDQLESLRNSIREDKVFEKIKGEVQINEISKQKYQKKNDEKINAESDEAENL